MTGKTERQLVKSLTAFRRYRGNWPRQFIGLVFFVGAALAFATCGMERIEGEHLPEILPRFFFHFGWIGAGIVVFRMLLEAIVEAAIKRFLFFVRREDEP